MASTYLSKTLGTSTNTYKGTVSVWLKRSGLSSDQVIYGNYTSGTQRGKLVIAGDGKLMYYQNDGGTNTIKLETNRLFRDVGAWYHIVLSVDTTQGTASDRVKLYVNGTQETSFATATYPSQNLIFYLNANSVLNYIGQEGNSSDYWDGSMTHFHFIDGTAYAPTSFGEVDSTSGIWKAKSSASVTYGTNGFFLKMENSGAMGTDSSGNGNNFTVSGSLTQNVDTPDNNFATGNPLYFTDSAWTTSLTNGNNTLTGHTGTNSYPTLASTIAMPSSGKWYTEFKLTSSSPYIYCGIATPECVSGTAVDGHYPNYDNEGGSNANAYSLWGNNGQKYVKENGGASSASSYGSGLSQNDIIQVACDLDNNKLYIGKNGTYFNSGVPTSGSTGTGAITILNNDYLMFMCDGGQSTDGSGQANFGSGFFGTTAVASANADGNGVGKMEYAVPTGYYTLNTKNLKEFG